VRNTDDQLVADYLRRLTAAAASLPADRRDELIEEISAHITESRAVGPDATGEGRVETSVAETLARLGDPDDIVRAAAEQAGPGQLGGPAGGGPTSIGNAPSGTGSYGPGPGAGGYLPGGYGPGGPGAPGGAYPNWPGAYGPPAPTASGLGAMEIAAVVLLLVGGFLAGIGWIVGVVLLWISPRWRLSDKLLGTLIWPGGLVGPLVVLSGGAFFAAGTSSTVCSESGINSSSGSAVTSSPQCSTAATTIPGWLSVTLLIVAVAVAIGGPVLVATRLVRQARRARQSYAATARPLA
jgi:hypothetical protein